MSQFTPANLPTVGLDSVATAQTPSAIPLNAGANQKVVVESPYHEENDQAQVAITAATASSLTATLYGNTNNNGQTTHNKWNTGENFWVMLNLGCAFQGQFRVSKPYLREIQHY